MIDDCIATARSIIEARLAKDQEKMTLQLRELKFEMVRKGGGSWHIRKMETLCKAHLEGRAQIILETFEQNLIGPRISSPDLNSKLKTEFLTHFTAHFQIISRVLQAQIKGQSYYRHVTLDHSRGRLISEYHARIDLLCRKIAIQESDSKPPTIAKPVIVSGSSNNVQVGDHNFQKAN